MLLKKVISTSAKDDLPASFLVEPLPGHTDDEVLTLLSQLGAADVELLAPGFISVTAEGGKLRRLEGVAHFQRKARKDPRG